MDWINQAQGRNQWRALVNTTMNLRVLVYLSDWQLLSKGSALWSRSVICVCVKTITFIFDILRK
jgi:hypothetical protein